MPRENTVTLIGRIRKPTISIIEDTGTYKLGFVMVVKRSNGRTDYPHVVVYGLTEERAREAWDRLKEGSWAYVRGMVSTRMVQKILVCPKCSLEKVQNILITEVIAFSLPLILSGDYDASEMSDMCNNVSIMGEVCTAVRAQPKADSVMYQVAIERRFHVVEQGSTRKDFPWVKTFGEQSRCDREHLVPSATVYVNGALQTRELMRRYVCTAEGCDGVIEYKDTSAEIISKNTEYIYSNGLARKKATR